MATMTLEKKRKNIDLPVDVLPLGGKSKFYFCGSFRKS